VGCCPTHRGIFYALIFSSDLRNINGKTLQACVRFTFVAFLACCRIFGIFSCRKWPSEVHIPGVASRVLARFQARQSALVLSRLGKPIQGDMVEWEAQKKALLSFLIIARFFCSSSIHNVCHRSPTG
jgi:hypothetical protein